MCDDLGIVPQTAYEARLLAGLCSMPEWGVMMLGGIMIILAVILIVIFWYGLMIAPRELAHAWLAQKFKEVYDLNEWYFAARETDPRTAIQIYRAEAQRLLVKHGACIESRLYYLNDEAY